MQEWFSKINLKERLFDKIKIRIFKSFLRIKSLGY